MKRINGCRVLFVALILIMASALSAEAQISFEFRDSLGVYKVKFTPYKNSDAARRFSRPLVAKTVEVRIGTAYCANTPTGYTVDAAWNYKVSQHTPDDNLTIGYPRWYTLSFDGGYWFRDWLYFGGSFVWTGGFSSIKNHILHKRVGYYEYNSFTLMPIVRFAWLRRGIVQLYSGVGIGLNVASYEHPDKFSLTYEGTVAYDVTFLGLSVGRNLFGYLDLGAGQRGVVTVGLGYRFVKK